jgi:hypothetical protein
VNQESLEILAVPLLLRLLTAAATTKATKSTTHTTKQGAECRGGLLLLIGHISLLLLAQQIQYVT